jgi:hypothetical protein
MQFDQVQHRAVRQQILRRLECEMIVGVFAQAADDAQNLDLVHVHDSLLNGLFTGPLGDRIMPC